MDSNTQIPAHYLEHLQSQLPAHIDIKDIVEAFRRPLRTSARVNVDKISIANCITLWKELGWKAEPIPWCDQGFWLDPIQPDNYVVLGNSFAHLQGLFYLQEASSMLPVAALKHNSNVDPECILDMAAAPGSKTTQLATSFRNSHIVGNEISASRLKSLHHNLIRCGHANQTLTNFNAIVFGEYLQETFDCILLDAPCSGEGTVRRDPEALKTWRISLCEELAELQFQLLVSGFHALNVGGEMVYSTCTLSSQENQQVLQRFINEFSNYVEIQPLNQLFPQAELSVTKEGYLHLFPHIYDTGGFFVAKLKKIARAPLPNLKAAKPRKNVFSALASAKYADLKHFFKQQYHYCFPFEPEEILSRDNEIWWIPSLANEIAKKVHTSRCGIKIAEQIKNGFRLHHEFVSCFANSFAQGCIELEKDEAVKYMQGQDIFIGNIERLSNLPQTGDLVVTYQGFALGCAKRIKSKLKNALPRDRVRDKPYQ